MSDKVQKNKKEKEFNVCSKSTFLLNKKLTRKKNLWFCIRDLNSQNLHYVLHKKRIFSFLLYDSLHSFMFICKIEEQNDCMKNT